MLKKILIGLVLLVAAGGAGGAYYLGYLDSYLGNDETVAEEETVEKLPEIYLPLDPPFVVNFTHRGTLRYLQVSVELMYSEQEIIDQINEKMPAVRNSLILLFSDQSYELLSSYEGKEELRQDILLAVNDVIGLKSQNGATKTGEAYFTNFVMQ